MKSCGCVGDNVLTRFPDKAESLARYIDSLNVCGDIDENRGQLINCLHKAQEVFGYLPLEVQELIADKLRLNISDVYGVISFYSFFITEPPGKYKIHVCLGTACFVRGADRILAEIEKTLDLRDGETSKDLKYSLSSLRCVGACSLAPILTVNDKVYANMTPQKVRSVLEEYK